MESGKLDQRIELQSLTEVNNHGSLTQSWVSEGKAWAYVVSQRGNEAFEAARTNAKETIRVCIRYRDVKNTWRLLWQGQQYNIVNTDSSQRCKGELWLTATVTGDL